MPSSTAVPTAVPTLAVPTAIPTLAPAKPISLSEHLDEGHASSADIALEGGSLSATDARGTSYTLTLPKDALAFDQEISLTPLTSVDGLPFASDSQFGVHVEPDGLDLLQPALLSVTTGAPPRAVNQVAAITYHGSGADAHPYPLDHAAGLQLTVTHFSSYIWSTSSSGSIWRGPPEPGGTSPEL